MRNYLGSDEGKDFWRPRSELEEKVLNACLGSWDLAMMEREEECKRVLEEGRQEERAKNETTVLHSLSELLFTFFGRPPEETEAAYKGLSVQQLCSALCKAARCSSYEAFLAAGNSERSTLNSPAEEIAAQRSDRSSLLVARQ